MKKLSLLIIGALFVLDMQAQKVQTCSNGKVGIFSKYRKWAVQPDYQYLEIINSKLIIASKNNREFGVISWDEKWVIRPKYQKINKLSESIFIGVLNSSVCELVNGDGVVIDRMDIAATGGITSYIRMPYASGCKFFIEEAINSWQKKGEFEKMADWKERVNEVSRQNKINELYKKYTDIYLLVHQGKQVTMSLGVYDADNEVYKVSTDYGDILVPVPISDAPEFKKRWGQISKQSKFFIDNGKLALAEVLFRMPDDNVYKYSNQNSLSYVATNIEYNFSPIVLPENQSSNNIQGSQNIKTVSIQMGRSDVDTDIPQSKKKNENTFAVIIANEDYKLVSPVPYARNDGSIFKMYCEKTLGIPENNIRYYENATYAQIIKAVNDLQTIANAFDGINVVFYYTGHGVPNEKTLDAFLLPIDTDGKQTETCYSVNKLYNELGNLRADRIMVFLDACFSGAKRDGNMLIAARGVAIKAKESLPKGKMVVFSAAQGDETAYPYVDQNHGMFTYYLLKKLQETKGNVTLGELGEYVTGEVKKQSILLNGKLQTPSVTPSFTTTDWENWKLR